MKVAKDSQGITDDDIKVLKDQGLSEGEIIEVVMMAGYAKMLDIYADVADLTLDGE